MLAVTEANRAGYDEAILLTADGFVADGSGENVFIVKDGELYTPDLSTSILPGITRDTVIQIAQDLGYTVHEKSLIRSDLYLADEVVHDRHRRRGDAAARRRRHRDRRSGRSRWRSRRPTWTPRAAGASAGRSGSSTPRPRRARRRSLSTGVRADPALAPVPRRARGGARPRGAALRAALARPDDRPFRGAARRAGRRAVRGGGLERDRGAAPALPHRRPRAGRRGDHLADLVRRRRRTASSSRARPRSSPTSTRGR